jgi:hypothetical protein
MSRIVLTDQDLSGKTINAHQGLVKGCVLNLTTRFLGDCRGMDFLGNDGPADWSQANTYSTYWRGNKNLAGSKFPADIGFLHHEPVAEILQQGLVNVPKKLRPIGEAIPGWVLSDYVTASWDTAWDAVIKGIPGATKESFIEVLRLQTKGFPGLQERVDVLEQALVHGEGVLWTPPKEPYSATVVWPDGAKVVVDAMNLPVLSDISRYALARWVEGQADTQQPGPHYCFVHSVLPPIVQILPKPDDWLEPDRRWQGY